MCFTPPVDRQNYKVSLGVGCNGGRKLLKKFTKIPIINRGQNNYNVKYKETPYFIIAFVCMQVFLLKIRGLDYMFPKNSVHIRLC